ncbi:sybindin-like family protein [Gregarina niphandrodes]|uniref:Trafficking protein particle complex subunit n=1 Tax=Gregarina niphandrodes TaxID=110365 RepID=A0A023B002_GRENI|nr:sybindin-like family protein [Gregarina niphandrodes]EZG44847.1 sybindin-like family protein [Gregarina niphandrodes]|eukprot:XP_011132649.1 sybindin-like family protein [Gregarina niphandrodes]
MSRIAASLAKIDIDQYSGSGQAGVPLKKRSDLIGLMHQNQGITLIQSDRHKMVCYETPTGLQLFCSSDLASPSVLQCRQYLEQIYQLYADCITKNPLCDCEMPIRLPFFDDQVEQLTLRY